MGPAPKLMIFDMDGTLTHPALDFDQIRAEIGIGSGTILEALQDMADTDQRRAFAIIERHERQAAESSELRKGVHQVVDLLRSRGIHTAIATRNSRASVQTVVAKHGLAVDHVHTREDGPVKPAPAPVLSICEYFRIAPEDTWVVGDYLYDIQSGKRAGAKAVLMTGGLENPAYADQADHVIHCLTELIHMLDNGKTL